MQDAKASSTDTASAVRPWWSNAPLPCAPFKRTVDAAKSFGQPISASLSGPAHVALYTFYSVLFIVVIPIFFAYCVVDVVGDPVRITVAVLTCSTLLWLVLESSWVFLDICTSDVPEYQYDQEDEGENLSQLLMDSTISSLIDNPEYPPATAVIVAFLPNEQDIIMETLAHFRAIKYGGELQVLLAYNTPKTLPVEREIMQLQSTWPMFTAVKVPDSTSKCDNVNEILKYINGDITGIFDADHLPLPNAFEVASKELLEADIVQGRTRINPRYVDSVMSHLLAAEFELRHGLEHQARKSVYSYAVFGGSNGFWRTSVLKTIGMDPVMLTEDVDSSIRAMSYGYRVTYNHHLISWEQPPPSWDSLIKQRLRWSQGWYQVSARSWLVVFSSSCITIRQKIGLLWMLRMWLPLQIIYTILQVFFLVVLSAKLGFVIVCCLSSMWAMPQLLFLFCFADLPELETKLLYLAALLPLRAFFMVLDLVAQVRLMIGYSTWHVTTRKAVSEETGLLPGRYRRIGRTASLPPMLRVPKTPSNQNLYRMNTLPSTPSPDMSTTTITRNTSSATLYK
eukprot:gene23059-27905_t